MTVIVIYLKSNGHQQITNVRSVVIPSTEKERSPILGVVPNAIMTMVIELVEIKSYGWQYVR